MGRLPLSGVVQARSYYPSSMEASRFLTGEKMDVQTTEKLKRLGAEDKTWSVSGIKEENVSSVSEK